MNAWEYITKKHTLPQGFPLPQAALDFVNGDRNQGKVLDVGIAVAHILRGDPLAALAAKGQADAIEKLLKKIEI